MYFPYLYGKQNELYALDEITHVLAHNRNVTPIIEPLKNNSTTINKLTSLSESNIPFILVLNPKNGDLSNKSDQIDELLGNLDLNNVSLGYILNTDTTAQDIETILSLYSKDNFSFIHATKPDTNLENILDVMKKHNNRVDYQIFLDGKVSDQYKRNFNKYRKVLVRDDFNKSDRNADYPAQTYFSDLYATYHPEYYGFGDFQLVGQELVENGGPAHAVALHLTHIDSSDELIVKHFVSDDTEGAENPGGKYLQAVQKLVDFVDSVSNPETNGIKDFKDTHQKGHYPGLGMAKRYSIKHHIELVSRKI